MCCMVKCWVFFSPRCAHLYLAHIFQYILIMWCHWFSCISKPVKLLKLTKNRARSLSQFIQGFFLFSQSSSFFSIYSSFCLAFFHFYHCTWSNFNKPFKTFAPMQRIYHQCNFTTSLREGEKKTSAIFFNFVWKSKCLPMHTYLKKKKKLDSHTA